MILCSVGTVRSVGVAAVPSAITKGRRGNYDREHGCVIPSTFLCNGGELSIIRIVQENYNAFYERALSTSSTTREGYQRDEAQSYASHIA
jgi:hypothetical protein